MDAKGSLSTRAKSQLWSVSTNTCMMQKHCTIANSFRTSFFKKKSHHFFRALPEEYLPIGAVLGQRAVKVPAYVKYNEVDNLNIQYKKHAK